jgi:hypothetical protein
MSYTCEMENWGREGEWVGGRNGGEEKEDSKITGSKEK